MLITQLLLLDQLLQRHAAVLGKDYNAYRNHCYRVINFCAALSTSDAVSLEKMAVAATFHDLGIWTHKTFDYLQPSETLAQNYLAENGKAEWSVEVGAMIQEHHKITRYKPDPSGLIEAFRKADWVDVSLGMIRCGIPRPFLREVSAAFPNAGFHKRLLQLSWARLLSHPFSPMPMMRF